MRILFCGKEFPGARVALRQCLSPADELLSCAAHEVLDAVQDVQVLIPAMTRVDAKILEAPDLRLVQQFATGVEGIDLVAAQERGIPVANIPAANTGNAQAVGEIVVLHLLALLRRLREAGEAVRRGELGIPVGRGLAGKRVVVLGLGAVAVEVLRRLRPFDADLVCVSRRSPELASPLLAELGVDSYYQLCDLNAALRDADALVICLRHGSDTTGLIGARELGHLSPNCVVVNVARGAIVDYAALRAGLDSGHIAGAGLDVYWNEPASPDDPLFDLNVSLTPHIGAVTEESYAKMAAVAAENIERIRDGRPILHRVA
jgi:phosphoglycerate dehydrogenase-like enzyme